MFCLASGMIVILPRLPIYIPSRTCLYSLARSMIPSWMVALTPITLIRSNRRLLEELLPLLGLCNKREQRILRRSSPELSLAVRDGAQDHIVTSMGLDTPGSWSLDGIGSGERLQLSILSRYLVDLFDRSGELRWQICPGVRLRTHVAVGCGLLFLGSRHWNK